MLSDNNKSELIVSARKLVGCLLYDMISRKSTPFEVLQKFPKGFDDISIKIAWHATIHFDSDEDIRKNDELYAIEQMTYIENIAKILLSGASLPNNILDEYKELYPDDILPKKQTFIEYIKSVFRFI